MKFWRLFSCFREEPDPVHPGILLDEDTYNVGQSSVCTQYNILGLRAAGYIDKEGLHNALTTIFSEKYGSLNFGITVYQGCLILVVGWQADRTDPKRPMDILRAKSRGTGKLDFSLAYARAG